VPTFSGSLEQALHRALALASERSHEYATLEHLLLALVDDKDAASVMRACGVDIEQLRGSLENYVDHDLASLIMATGEDAKPTAGFQRVIQRAVIHVQSSGREEVTGANVLVAIFAERESHAAYFLQEQDMTRYDAVNFISHGIAKKPGLSESRSVQGAERRRLPRPAKSQGDGEKSGDALDSFCINLNQKATGRQDRSADRARGRGQPHHPGAVPPVQEQPAVRGRPRVLARRPLPRALPARSSMARCRKCSRIAPSSSSTWVCCWPARATAVTLKNA
jgi:ATP-dependent Clp protease ATP-binding subunit ClpA